MFIMYINYWKNLAFSYPFPLAIWFPSLEETTFFSSFLEILCIHLNFHELESYSKPYILKPFKFWNESHFANMEVLPGLHSFEEDLDGKFSLLDFPRYTGCLCSLAHGPIPSTTSDGWLSLSTYHHCDIDSSASLYCAQVFSRLHYPTGTHPG